MKKLAATFSLFLFSSSLLFAQVSIYGSQHRPNGVNWKELNTSHFRIIFPEGNESNAFRAGRILESQYEITYALTGGTLKGFPFVLTNYNDLTNGFVTALNFRSEVDLAPFKGKSINPQSGSWLEAVLPHELLHANQANVIEPRTASALLSIFSPDFGRAINFFPPLGTHEGLAVYHESVGGAISQYSGRSNYTYYTNRYNSVYSSGNPWSLGQHLIISDYTEPGDRHYLGGSHFTHWLHEAYGDPTSREAISTHQRFFFLGYGFALRSATGKWPGALFEEYKTFKTEEELNRVSGLSRNTDAFHTIIDSPYKGVEQRKPIWLSDDTLLFYSTQYNSPRGFYTHSISTSATTKLKEVLPVQDFYMEYQRSSNTLYFAEYFALNQYSGAYQTDIVALNLDSGTEELITDGSRTFAPQFIGDNLFALQPEGNFANLVRIDENGTTIIKQFEDETPIALEANPAYPAEFALILNRRGVQALWITSLQTLEEDVSDSPTIAFKGGSIHDVSWHSSGQKMLFTADMYPAMNVYEYDLESGQILQLTNSLFNAFEPGYSPDDEKIAYVTQVEEEQRIAVLERSNFYNLPVASEALLAGGDLTAALARPFLGDELLGKDTDWIISDYKTNYKWLRPRAVLPVVESKGSNTEWGVYFTSTDVLQSQDYAAQLTTYEDQLWYDLSYTNKSFFPGVKFRTYREPSAPSYLIGGTIASFLQEEQGAELSIPYEYSFSDIARFSSFSFTPSIAWERLQLTAIGFNEKTGFATQFTPGFFTQLSLKLLQLPRDVQPSSGAFFFAQFENTFGADSLQSSVAGLPVTFYLKDRSAVFFGSNFYLSPLQKLNQSLLIEFRGLLQSENLIYSTDNIKPLGFPSEVFAASNQLGRIGTRYTVPLTYPDNGGFLVPFYLSSIYTSLFTHALFDFTNNDPVGSARSILGAGVHFRFKISNLAFDLGLGFAFDPTTHNLELIVGDF